MATAWSWNPWFCGPGYCWQLRSHRAICSTQWAGQNWSYRNKIYLLATSRLVLVQSIIIVEVLSFVKRLRVWRSLLLECLRRCVWKCRWLRPLLHPITHLSPVSSQFIPMIHPHFHQLHYSWLLVVASTCNDPSPLSGLSELDKMDFLSWKSLACRTRCQRTLGSLSWSIRLVFRTHPYASRKVFGAPSRKSCTSPRELVFWFLI